MECAKNSVKVTFNQNRALNNGTISKEKHKSDSLLGELGSLN